MKILSFLKSTLTVIFSTVVFFGVLELVARLFFSEFAGEIHSAQKTLGKNYFLSKTVPGRVPYPDYVTDLSKPLVLVLGDSISHGYGQAYEDIYWVRVMKMMQTQLGAKAPEFVSLSYYGNDLNDSIKGLTKFLREHPEAKVSEVLYQFNFNDVVPEAYGREGLHESDVPSAATAQQTGAQQTGAQQTGAQQTGAQQTAAQSTDPQSKGAQSTGDEPAKPEANLPSQSWFKTLSLWRAEYLNYSVFLRTAQHYAGTMVRVKSGTCEARGVHALGPYTWTFGSKKYAKESEALWANFSDAVKQLKAMADARGFKLSIMISPLLFDIDTMGLHDHYNYLNYDFSCATINPRERLATLAQTLNLKLYDPTTFIKTSFEGRVKEGNWTPFFFTADENHITPAASSLMADYLYAARLQGQND